MKKRSGRNSATSAVAGFVGAINDQIALPAGLELRSEAELIIWHQFTRARARSEWRDMDLILLAKIVKMEADSRAAQIALGAMGMMIEIKRGVQYQIRYCQSLTHLSGVGWLLFDQCH